MVSCLFPRVDLVNCSPCCQLAVCWILSWVRQAVDKRIAFLVSIIFSSFKLQKGRDRVGLLSERGEGRGIKAFIKKGEG